MSTQTNDIETLVNQTYYNIVDTHLRTNSVPAKIVDFVAIELVEMKEKLTTLHNEMVEKELEGFRDWHNEKMVNTTYLVGGVNFTPKLRISEESLQQYLLERKNK